VLEQKQPDLRLEAGDVVFVPKANMNVYVGGEVGTPGLVSMQGRTTVAAAIIRAGGFRETARSDSVILLRQGPDGKPQATKLNVSAVLERGGADLDLRPYDVVFVPKSTIAKVDRFIEQYVRQLLPISMNAGFSYVVGGGFFR